MKKFLFPILFASSLALANKVPLTPVTGIEKDVVAAGGIVCCLMGVMLKFLSYYSGK